MERSEQRIEDTWDLSALSESPEKWQKSMKALRKRLKEAQSFKGHLADSSDSLYSAMCYLRDVYMELEKLGSWAFLCYAADSSNAEVQMRAGLSEQLNSEFSEKLSYFDPELMAIPEEMISSCLKEPRFREFRVYIRKSRRYREHILSEKEERILSLYSPVSSSPSDAFDDLNDIDLDFGSVNGEKLTHATYARFIRSEDESIRKEAYSRLYGEYDRHQHVIARLYGASVKNDIFISKARGFRSSLEKALFPDKVPESVYTSLIRSVHDAFPALHRYYELKARMLGKEKLRHYDAYMPMARPVKSAHSYREAVDIITEAVKPLGDEYTSVLRKGLLEDRWVDRYENKGKTSGAFSAGGYIGNPYILTNFQEEVLDSVFTLIHEGGHSMHSYYSARNNPFMCYSYTIFEAEVASTFNECLLSEYLIAHSGSKEEEAYLVAKRLDDVVATLFRQTMFAEFELIIHQEAEKGTPVTIDMLRRTYRRLLEEYFGPIMEFEPESDLECLRIPHFYRAFYCYKYSTGISAAMALSERVLRGGDKERDDYLSFLRSGGSGYPIDSLRKAGVDMRTPEPVRKATEKFSGLLDRFESLI